MPAAETCNLITLVSHERVKANRVTQRWVTTEHVEMMGHGGKPLPAHTTCSSTHSFLQHQHARLRMHTYQTLYKDSSVSHAGSREPRMHTYQTLYKNPTSDQRASSLPPAELAPCVFCRLRILTRSAADTTSRLAPASSSCSAACHVTSSPSFAV